MITLEYLNDLLPKYGYVLQEVEEHPVFWKKIKHVNVRDKLAFTLIIVTLDKYTVTIEGMNEMLIRRAVDAGVIEIPDLKTLDALRDIIYDTTLDENTNKFETMFLFFEKQIQVIEETDREEEAYQKAIENIRIMIDAANDAIL